MSLTTRELTLLMAAILRGESSYDDAINRAKDLISEYDRSHRE